MDQRLEALRNDRSRLNRANIDEAYLAGVLRGLIFLFVAGLIFLAVSFTHSLLQMSWTSYNLQPSHVPLTFAVTRRNYTRLRCCLVRDIAYDWRRAVITARTIIVLAGLVITMGANPVEQALLVRSCQLKGIGQAECAIDDLPGVVACPSAEAQDCSDDR